LVIKISSVPNIVIDGQWSGTNFCHSRGHGFVK
jgi:hypothetical protein